MKIVRSTEVRVSTIHGFTVNTVEALGSKFVKSLADSIESDGLISRPQVLEDGRIVCGQHRVLAHIMLKRDLVPVDIVKPESGFEEADIAIRNRAENLFRRVLTPAERKEAVAEYFQHARARAKSKLEAKWEACPEERPKNEGQAIRRLAKAETAAAAGMKTKTLENILSETMPVRQPPDTETVGTRRAKRSSESRKSKVDLAIDDLGIPADEVDTFQRHWLLGLGKSMLLLKALDEVLTKAKAMLTEAPPEMRTVDVDVLSERLTEAQALCAEFMPYSVCTTCNGDEDGESVCTTCGGHGYEVAGPE